VPNPGVRLATMFGVGSNALGSCIVARPKRLGSIISIKPKKFKTFFILLIFFELKKKQVILTHYIA